MWSRKGWENRSLEQVIDFELSKLSESTPEQLAKGDHWHYENRYGFLSSYLLRSLYVYHIQRWLQVFPKEQCFFLESQQLSQAPQQTLSEVFNFLELDDCRDIDYHQRNKGAYNKNSGVAKKLEGFFRPHNALLETCLDRKFDWPT